MNRMKKLIFYSDNDDGIARNFLVYREVNTEKESNDDQAEENDSSDLPFFAHHIRFRLGILPTPREGESSIYNFWD